jgi:glutamate-1-semialdehyde aminotransferase
MEPMGVCFPDEGYLESVRDLATQHKVVLIFDECWTGFRIHLQGAYGRFNVEPDIACFGKALGNGVPISAIVGKSEIMDCLDEVFFSFTFGGDMLGIVAANEVLTTLENEPVLDHVHMLGENLIKGINNLLLKYELSNRISLSGYHARSVLNFTNNGVEDLLLKSLFQQESISRGILAAGWHAPSYSHTQSDVDKTLEVYNDVFNSLSYWIDNNSLSDNLHGEIVQPVFRRL